MEAAQTLGPRSCLYNSEGVWLFGAQALAAARHQKNTGELIDAFDALAWAAGYGNVDDGKRTALPKALWNFVDSIQANTKELICAANSPGWHEDPADGDEAKSNQAAEKSFNLALLIPDGRLLGQAEVQESGKTHLECLHHAIVKQRPPRARRCQIELIWRSVAALKALCERESAINREGRVLVISINRKVFWTELELMPWSRDGRSDGPLRIVRKPVMDDCDESESW
ncbi:MAG: hypothetical protein OXC91_00360, partial [Rhodobacteraceae bacterium]|nr:hypothetical protein [Paracoccaceae bacterium]